MKRKTIQINESVFNSFDETRKALKLNSSDTLQTLLQKEFTKTESFRVENSGDFDNCCKQFNKNKKVGENEFDK